MNRLPLRGPGLQWLPAALRRPAYWRTVWRFTWLGPLVGGLPYLVLIVSIPFAYAIGVVPAFLSGLLFAAWWHAPGTRWPTWPWRALIGLLCGTAASAAMAAIYVLGEVSTGWSMVAVTAAHGVPAAMVLALLQRPPKTAAPIAQRTARDQAEADDPFGTSFGTGRELPSSLIAT